MLAMIRNDNYNFNNNEYDNNKIILKILIKRIILLIQNDRYNNYDKAII